MILHFSHIGLTDGLTFMIPFELLYPDDVALAPAAGRRYQCRSRAHTGILPHGARTGKDSTRVPPGPVRAAW